MKSNITPDMLLLGEKVLIEKRKHWFYFALPMFVLLVLILVGFFITKEENNVAYTLLMPFLFFCVFGFMLVFSWLNSSIVITNKRVFYFHPKNLIYILNLLILEISGFFIPFLFYKSQIDPPKDPSNTLTKTLMDFTMNPATKSALDSASNSIMNYFFSLYIAGAVLLLVLVVVFLYVHKVTYTARLKEIRSAKYYRGFFGWIFGFGTLKLNLTTESKYLKNFMDYVEIFETISKQLDIIRPSESNGLNFFQKNQNCGYCGAENDFSGRYCHKCGKLLLVVPQYD